MNMKDVVRERERHEAIEDARRKRQRTLTITSTVLGITLIGTLTAFVQVRILNQSHKNDEAQYAIETLDRLRNQQAAIGAMKAQLDSLTKSSQESQSSGLTLADRQALDEAKKAEAGLDQRITALENALLQTPDKALAVPLLKQQLLDIEDKDKSDSENIHGEINSLYTMMEWILGLMITLIIGVGGLLISTLREKNKPVPKPEPQEAGS